MKPIALISLAAFMLLQLFPLVVIALLGGIFALGIIALRKKNIAEDHSNSAPIHSLPSQPASHREQYSEPTELTLRRMALGVISRRIGEELKLDFENARWVWETPNPMRALANGESLVILLNRADGYRRAEVLAQGLQYAGIRIEGFHTKANDPPLQPDEPENHEPKPSEAERQQPETEPTPVDYSFLVSQWIETHRVELIEIAGTAAHDGEDLFLPAEKLPEMGSWPCLCGVLVENGFTSARPDTDGIRVMAA